MATRRITLRICDGCHRNDRDGALEFTAYPLRWPVTDYFGAQTIDICVTCDKAGWCFCDRCRKTHQSKCPLAMRDCEEEKHNEKQ